MSATREATRPAARSAEAPPHPRIRARRVEVARDLGRRRRRRLNVVLALICLGVWSLVTLRSALLDLDRVQVSGAELTSEAEITAALGLGLGTPMVEIDSGAAAARVEALPWVDEARVSRLWPGTVRVQVTERAPVAVAAHPDGWATVDADGQILAVTPDRPAGLVALEGSRSGAPGAEVPASDREVLRTLARLSGALRADVVTALTGPDGVALVMAEGPCIVLGDSSQLAAKATAADAVRQRLTEADTARLDVRVPSAPALTRGAGCA